LDKDHFAGLPAVLSPVVDEPPAEQHHSDHDDDRDDEHDGNDDTHGHQRQPIVISTDSPLAPAPTPTTLSNQSSLGSTSSNDTASHTSHDKVVADLPSFGLERSASSMILSLPVENKRLTSGGSSGGNNSDDEVPKPPHGPLRIVTGASPNNAVPSPRPSLLARFNASTHAAAVTTTSGAVNALTPVVAHSGHNGDNDDVTKPTVATGTLVEWPFPRILRTRTRARVCVCSMYISTTIVILAQIAISIYYLVWLDKSLV
jgi:hypothetical protein